MLRRTPLAKFGYIPHDASKDMMIRYSPFGWNYLLPQNMVAPWRVNRTMTKPYKNTHKKITKYLGVWVDLEPMPPVMQEALKPWLSKLALGRELPTTDPAEAIADFEKIAPSLLEGAKNRREQDEKEKESNIFEKRAELKKMLVGNKDASSSSSAKCLIRSGIGSSNDNINNNNSNNAIISSIATPEELTFQSWLAKVIQLCAMKKQNDSGLELWKKFSPKLLESFLPEANLASAVVYCMSGSSADPAEFHSLFNLACERDNNNNNISNTSSSSSLGWNVTQHFDPNMWNYLLFNRGLKGDELGVLMIFRELGNIQYNVDHLSADCILVALNSIKSDEHYKEVKEFTLNLFGADKINMMKCTYIKLRSKAEMLAENEEELSEEQEAAKKQLEAETSHSIYYTSSLTHKELPENDKMFYHVQWHDRVRQPMDFMPRRLFFDYKPSLASSKGASEARKNASDIVADRVKTWKEQGLLPEDYSQDDVKYTDFAANYKNAMRDERYKKAPEFLNKPHLSGSLLTSGLAGKKAG